MLAMQRTSIIALTILVAGPGLCRGQFSGNIAYAQGGGKARAEQAERNKRVLTAQELPPSSTSMFVEANVLMNVKADEYVAVFGISQEGDTPAECSRKMDATIKEFSDALRPMGIGGDDLFVDFVAQNKIYGFEVQGDIAREKLVGFELKKNVLIHYKDRSLLDKLVVAAARSQIFDLIKVDYLVKDINRVQDKLMEEAARVIKQKTARYEKLLGIKLQPPGQVYAERPAIHYPTGMYDSYTAFESEQMGTPPDRQKYAVQAARKGRTFVFNGLDGDGFDDVINPVVVEPVVQFTLYLKVKYEVEQIKAK
jgi:uncharacterized protein YggE